MRRFLIFTIIALFISTIVLLVVDGLSDPAPQATLINKIEPMKEEFVKSPPVIEEINKRNAKIKNFSCSRIKVRVWQNGMRFRLKGSLYYEKDKRFRMVIKSIFGKEVDLGSNDEIFWYWSRRDEEKALLYAKHEDYGNTRLKTPFNPIFMKGSLGLNQIHIDNYKDKILDMGSSIIINHRFKNAVGKTVVRSTFIDKNNKRIAGFVVSTEDGEIVASAEISEYASNGSPKKILYVWNKENKVLLLEMENPRINTLIDSQFWELPNLSPKIDIGK